MSFFVVNGPRARWAGVLPVVPEQRQELFLYAVVIIGLSLVLALSGAFDTDELGISHRLALWFTVCVLIISQAGALDRVVRRMLRGTRAATLVSGATAVGITVVLMAVELHALKFTPLLPKKPDPLFEFLLFVAPPVGVIAILSLLLSNIKRCDSDRQKTAAASPDDANDWPGGRVFHVSAEDHYLQVVTEQGSALVRGRMKDAVLRLRDRRGLQVHRSHWVAVDQLDRIVRRGRDYRLILIDGTAVPVGRSRLAVLRRDLPQLF